MSDPIFSIIASAIRPENYKRCYDSFSFGSNVSFEMIFVGNIPPIEEVGKNFRYIYSTVKPAQCFEIGARKSEGRYIIPVADDVEVSNNFFEHLLEEVTNTDTSKYLLSFMGNRPGNMVYDKNIKNSPSVGWFGCFPKDLWKSLGGIDKRFIVSFCDTDLQMRAYEMGLQFKLAKNIYVREFFPDFGKNDKERKKFRNNRMIQKYGNYSRTLLNSFWVNPDGTMSKKRLSPVEPFEDKDIVTITQGEKGEW